MGQRSGRCRVVDVDALSRRIDNQKDSGDAQVTEKFAIDVSSLKDRGIAVEAFDADLADSAVTKRTVAAVRAKLGPITALHRNVASGAAGDLLAADTDAIHSAPMSPSRGWSRQCKAAYPDLKSEGGAVLITTGGLGMLADWRHGGPDLDDGPGRGERGETQACRPARGAAPTGRRLCWRGDRGRPGQGHGIRPRQCDHRVQHRCGQVLELYTKREAVSALVR